MFKRKGAVIVNALPRGYPKGDDENTGPKQENLCQRQAALSMPILQEKFVHNTMQVICHPYLPADTWINVLETHCRWTRWTALPKK